MKEFFDILLIQPLANGLILFYKVLGQNMGLAIIGFGVFLRLILTPLTKPYMNSMKKMKEFEPQLNKLKLKYKDDKQKLLQAQTEFYKQNKINPGAGCLPYILQIIVLIALFNVFTRVLSGGDIASKLNELLYPQLKFAQDTTINTRFLYMDITKPDVFKIPGLSFPIPGPILILAAFLQFISAKMMQPMGVTEKKKNKDKPKEEDMQTAMQSSMIYTFPLFTLIFGLSFASGLALYWMLFSLIQVWQQYQTSGWGSLSPWISKLGLLKSTTTKEK